MEWTHERRHVLERIAMGGSISRGAFVHARWLEEHGLVTHEVREDAGLVWKGKTLPGGVKWSLTQAGVDALQRGPLPERRLTRVEVEALREYMKPPMERTLRVRRDVEQRLDRMRLLRPTLDKHGWANQGPRNF